MNSQICRMNIGKGHPSGRPFFVLYVHLPKPLQVTPDIITPPFSPSKEQKLSRWRGKNISLTGENSSFSEHLHNSQKGRTFAPK